MSLLTEELQTLLNSIHTAYIHLHVPPPLILLCFPLHAHISNFSFILLPYLLLHYFIFLSFSLSLSCSPYLSDSSFFFILSVFFISSFLVSKCALFSFPLLTFSLYLSRVIFLQKCLFWHFLPSIFSSFTCSLCYDRGVGVGFGLINTTASPSSAPLSGSGH